MGIRSYGVMGVDWEERANFERLRTERLARAKAGLARSELGALLCFDMSNIRYITATHIGTWAVDKYVRFCLLPQGDDPIMWDFGSAARHHKIYSPWLGEGRSRAGISTLRGDRSRAGPRTVAEKIRVELAERGLLGEPLGVDVVELSVLFALERGGHRGRRRPAADAACRMIKSRDEITLLDTACMMVDAAYEQLYRAMRPGMRENECVGLVSKALYDLGSEHVEGVNAISGERCSPHPHVYSDRVLRPGDPAYFDILHSYMGYRTCYYRTFAVGSASPALVDAYKRCRFILDAAIAQDPPGRHDRRGRLGVAEGAGVRLPQRGGGVRAPVRSRRRALDLGEADHLAPGLTRAPRGDRGGHGLRARDLLAVDRRLVGGADRGAARRDRRRLRGDHALPGRGSARLRQSARDGGWAAARDPRDADPISTTQRSPTSSPPRPAARGCRSTDGRRGDHARARDGAGDRQGAALAQGRGRRRGQGRAAARDRDGQGHCRARSARRRDARRGERRRGRRGARRAGDRATCSPTARQHPLPPLGPRRLRFLRSPHRPRPRSSTAAGAPPARLAEGAPARRGTGRRPRRRRRLGPGRRDRRRRRPERRLDAGAGRRARRHGLARDGRDGRRRAGSRCRTSTCAAPSTPRG